MYGQNIHEPRRTKPIENMGARALWPVLHSEGERNAECDPSWADHYYDQGTHDTAASM